MKARIVMASGEISITRGGATVTRTVAVDHEEIDGWVGAHRVEGEWTTWTRRDGAYVHRPRGGELWLAWVGGDFVLDRRRHKRRWGSAAAARAAVDREHPIGGALAR